MNETVIEAFAVFGLFTAVSIIITLIYCFWKWVREKLEGAYEKCYSNRMCEGNAYDGRCGGLAGGTKATDYLSEGCVGCPYLELEVMKDD